MHPTQVWQNHYPFNLAADIQGKIYITKSQNCKIRKLALVGADRMVNMIAGRPGFFGSQDGAGTSALFYLPTGAMVDTVEP